MVQSRLGFNGRRSYARPVRQWYSRTNMRPGRIVSVVAGVGMALWAAVMLGANHFSPSTILVETVGQIAREGARLGPAMGGWLSMDPERGKVILQQTMPSPAEAMLETTPQLSWQNRLRFWLYMALDYDITQPKTLLEAMLPHAAPANVVVQLPSTVARRPGEDVDFTTQAVQNDPDIPKVSSMSNYENALASVRHANTQELAQLQQADWGSQPLVLIYHTHGSEMYKLGNAQAGAEEPHRYNTTDTGIMRAGEVLAKTLSDRYGIPVVHSKAIHDFPSFAHAYTSSARTVRALLEKYPSIQVVIDVHRDAAENVSFVREINSVQAAQVMVVVSKLGETKPSLHPRWRENMQFAAQMEEKMRELYPNLLRRYPPVTSRYNQQLHPNMVLLEIGNYMDEEVYALRSAAMMADVVATMVDYAKRKPVRNAAATVQPAQSAAAVSTRPVATAKPTNPALQKPQPQERPVSSAAPNKAQTPPTMTRPTPNKVRP